MPTEATAAAALDAAARRRALAVDASFLVRAPAGSGKTELLIQRMLALLGTVEQPEAVVALTFTRKAAGEMRARLLEALERAAREAAPEEAHARQTWELARRVRERDEAKGWGLLQAPARLRVMTLDALALGLVRRMPWRTRQGGAPQPEEHPEEMYRTAAAATLARIESGDGDGAEAARRLLRQVDANLEKAAELLAELLPVRDQWLPLVGAAGGGEGLREAIERELAERLRDELAQVRRVVEASARAAELVRLGRAAGNGLEALPGAAVEDLERWQGLAELALTQEGGSRRSVPAWLGLGDSDRKALRELELGETARAALHATRGLPPPRLREEPASMVAALAEALPLAAAELEVIFAARGVCDFVAVAMAAQRGLGEADTPSALAYALDGQLRHLLVDEFQDTSQAQYALLASLVADWQEGDGRTLFLVGDPMQSIYRFRYARVELFLQTAAVARLGPVAIEELELRHNYRSQAGLVTWCNQRFGQLFPAADDIALGAAGFGAAAATRTAAAAAVEVHALASDDIGAEAERVGELVEQALAEGAAEVAILVHGRSHLRAILPELRRRGVGYQGVKLQKLGKSQTVADLLALTRALYDPADRVAWLALLRGPWCGLTLADLHALCGDSEGDGTVATRYAARRGQLSADGQQRAERVVAAIEAAGRERGRVAARPLVEWCWQVLGGPECPGVGSTAAAAAFFAQLEARDHGDGGLDTDALAAALKDLVAPPVADDRARVKIMTAHQAKGLEFDTVILPGLGRTPKAEPQRLLRWLERAGKEGEARWLMAPRPARGDQDPLYEFVGEQQKLHLEQEQLRLLYVTATRARRRLHLVAAQPRKRTGEWSDPAARSPLARLWPALAGEFERQRPQEAEDGAAVEAGAAAAAAAVVEAPRLRRVMAGWAPAAAEAEVSWQGGVAAAPPSAGAHPLLAPSGALRRQIGTAVHATLQRMAEGGVLQWDAERLRRRLRQAGVASEEMEAAQAQAERALGAMVGDERGRWILGAHAGAHCEWEVSGVVEGRLQHAVMDRSFVDEAGVRWVIDYKTLPHQGGEVEAFLEAEVERYREQVAAYVRLLEGMEERPVRGGLYFVMQAAWRAV